MRRLLIVSPHFAPVNAPDMHRVRLSLPFLRGHGWEPVVLAVSPDTVEGAVVEPLLTKTYPHDIRVVRVQGVPARLTRWAGCGNLWWRSGRAIRRAGDELMREQPFDLVFFSTTQFAAFQLGPRWLQRHGVPYVLDYQDPWTNSYYRRTRTRPPGGRLKYALSQMSARRLEPAALRGAGGVVAVSEAYGQLLHDTYPWFDPSRAITLPFGAADTDFSIARAHRPHTNLIDFADGNLHYVYAGRGGQDMNAALRALFRAFRLHLDRSPETARKIRFHFIGTGYAPPPLGTPWALPVAHAEGVAEYVSEHCYRVPYFDALYYLSRADALVAVGSDDPGYSASKIFPYLFADRPLLIVFHENSTVMRLAGEASAGVRCGFNQSTTTETLAADIYHAWFASSGHTPRAAANHKALHSFTAEARTCELAKVFDKAASRVCSPDDPGGSAVSPRTTSRGLSP